MLSSLLYKLLEVFVSFIRSSKVYNGERSGLLQGDVNEKDLCFQLQGRSGQDDHFD